MSRRSSGFARAVTEREIETARTVCGICSGTCGMTVTLENGKVRSIEGDEGHPTSRGHLCPKGRAFMELLAARDRLEHPLRKVAADKWEQISWEEALGFLTERLKKIKQGHGPEALALHIGQAGVGKEFSDYVERFANLYGTPNFSTSGSHCVESKLMASMLTYGAMPLADFENSKCIVLWGKNPLSSTPSLVGTLRESRARGCAMVVIDPKETAIAREADLHLQLRPGTDGALALGMLHVIVEERLYDKHFVDAWTVGFDKLPPLLSGYRPERVQEITGVPASKVRQAALLYAASRHACISQGVALELSTNGFQALRAIAILQAITGNLDVSGGALFLKTAKLSELRLIRRDGRKPAIGSQEHPLFHASTGHAQANLYAESILKGSPYSLKGLVVVGSNPVLTWPNADKVRRALAKIEFLAVMDPFMTETARLADLILPCASFLGGNELWDTSHLSSEPRLGVAPKSCDEEGLPTNWEIWKKIGMKMGYADFFPWETEEEAIDFRLQPLNLTLAELKGMPGGYVYHQWVQKKFEKEGFRTPSGRVEIYSAELAKHGYDPLPTYREPAESPLSTPTIAREYPLVLTTGARTVGYLHSRFHNVPSLLSRRPEPLVEINPRTARDLHVADGEMVVVETRRGKIEVKVKYTNRVLAGTIMIPHGWDQANANVLTDDIDVDPVTGFPADRALLARIVKKTYREGLA
jgi:formate dehydrogenase (coenzyme F420) alpha subunit